MSYPGTPPRRLSSDRTHPDYHPCYKRVGVRLDGAERRDVRWYDAEAAALETVYRDRIEGTVEPYWRWAESRQQRRLRERWGAERGAPA